MNRKVQENVVSYLDELENPSDSHLSPYKISDWVNEIGLSLESDGVKFLVSDFNSISKESSILKETKKNKNMFYLINPSCYNKMFRRYFIGDCRFLDDCTWYEAYRKAIENGGYLAHINSEEEYQRILDEIEENNYIDIQFKIGGRRNNDSLDYRWINDSNTTYGEKLNTKEYWAHDEWQNGEPSFYDGDIVENCLEIYYSEKENRFVWNDIPDDVIGIVPYFSGKLGYIVEYE